MNRRVVLAGAGHAHLHLLKNVGALQRAGAEVHVIAPEDFWYSGMATGMLGGLFSPEEDRIGIAALLKGSGAILHRNPMSGLDRAARKILIEGEPPLDFDILSLNLGSAPPDLSDPQAALYPVKPVRSLVELRRRLEERAQIPTRIAIIGGGVTGMEIAANLQAFAQARGQQMAIAVFSQSEPLQQLPPGARKAILRHLKRRGVVVNWPTRIAMLDAHGVTLESGERHLCDLAINAAGLSPASLNARLGVRVAEDGGLVTDEYLRSPDDPAIFAVGDCAAFAGKSLPRIGVYAVRQAPVLLHNIVATLTGQPLRRFQPQRHYLSILGLGASTALMVRGGFWLKGPPALWLKHWIDRRFVESYRR